MYWYVKFFVFAAIMFFLPGCNDARYPIDPKPLVKVESRFLGKWIGKEKDEYYVVSQKDVYHYQISYTEKKNSDPTVFPAYMSMVDNVLFLNMMDYDESQDTIKGYAFLKVFNVNKTFDKVSAAVVADTNLKNQNSSAEVRAFITKNLKNSKFFGDVQVLRKVK